MSNNDIGRAFTELKALFQKKGYLLFDDVPDTIKNGVLTKDVQFGSPSTAAKVLIGNLVNGNIVWVDSNGYTLKQLLAEK